MRTYIPEWGCFTSPDMKNDVFDTMGMGSYGFPYNNPLIYTDPSGLDGNLKRAKGHHKVVMSSLEKMDFSEAALTVLNPVGWNDGKHGDVLLKEIKSGNIKIPPSMVYTPVGHQYSTAHSIYNSKIEELANDYLKQINKNASDLNEKEAKKLLKYIEKDPYIKGFNKATTGGWWRTTKWFINDGVDLMDPKYKKKVNNWVMKFIANNPEAKTFILKNLSKSKNWVEHGGRWGLKGIPYLGPVLILSQTQQAKAAGIPDELIIDQQLNDASYGAYGMSKELVEAMINYGVELGGNFIIPDRSYLDANKKWPGDNGEVKSDEFIHEENRHKENQLKAGDLYDFYK